MLLITFYGVIAPLNIYFTCLGSSTWSWPLVHSGFWGWEDNGSWGDTGGWHDVEGCGVCGKRDAEWWEYFGGNWLTRRCLLRLQLGVLASSEHLSPSTAGLNSLLLPLKKSIRSSSSCRSSWESSMAIFSQYRLTRCPWVHRWPQNLKGLVGCQGEVV